MKTLWLFIPGCLITVSLFAQPSSNRNSASPDSIATHKVVLDNFSKIISWMPQSVAYDRFVRDRWNFILRGVPNSPGPVPRSDYPQYYFYCAYKDQQMIPDTWMNDVGEKIPNWFESARLFYQYSGDARPLDIVTKMAAYAIDHGTSVASFSWPYFPYTTTNAGDTLFRGFTNGKRFVAHEIQVDHAGDMGLTYFRLFLYTGKEKFKAAAIRIANVLGRQARTGTASKSVWPYRVVMSSGKITAEYAANWIGCYSLLDGLVKAKMGDISAYENALKRAKDFMLQFPMRTGYWTDGHTDTDVNSNTYKSNMSASNMTLYLFDHPDFDPDYITHIPALIHWTEENFVNRCLPGEPSTQWGANIVGEQDSFLPKMDYQTARYGAECARWYAVSGDSTFKEKAYRALNWVTYCSDSNGLAFESPLSNNVTSWWSDCYGEGPRMFYQAIAAVPEWAPPAENHILYSDGLLKDVLYGPGKLGYTAAENSGTEYIKLAFKPVTITLNDREIPQSGNRLESHAKVSATNDGNYFVTINRKRSGQILIAGAVIRK